MSYISVPNRETKNIIDGVGSSLLLKIDEDELITNRYFDSNTTGWYSSNATITRTELDTSFGNHVLKIEDTDIINRGYCYYQALVLDLNYDGIVFGAWIKGIRSESWVARLDLYDHTNLIGWKNININEDWNFYSIFIPNIELTDGRIIVQISPTSFEINKADIYMVASKMRLVSNYYQIGYPDIRSDMINKNLDFGIQLDNDKRKIIKWTGCDIIYSFKFTNINRNTLNDVILAGENRHLAFFANADSDVFDLIYLEGNITYPYLSNKYIGHDLKINFKPLEHIEQLSIYKGW